MKRKPAKNAGLSLDPETLRLLDREAERLSMARSTIVKLIVRAALDPSYGVSAHG